jgi:hypothetical protein
MKSNWDKFKLLLSTVESAKIALFVISLILYIIILSVLSVILDSVLVFVMGIILFFVYYIAGIYFWMLSEHEKSKMFLKTRKQYKEFKSKLNDKENTL